MNKRVLLITNELSEYRIPVFNIVSEQLDLTIAYTENDKSKDSNKFKKVKLTQFNLGPFKLIKGIFKFCKQYDVVIFTADMHNLSLCMLPFIKREYKVISWSIGLRASYTRPFDINRHHDFLDRIYGRILSKCDANIFYMDCVKKFWSDKELNHNQIFVTRNSVAVADAPTDMGDRRDFIFVGSLYKAKGIDKLLEAFVKVMNKYGDRTPYLHIIGGGEREDIEKFIKEHQIEDRSILYGPIYDENELAKYFGRSILSISPNQAGLSVIKSMGYGVPFVTKKNAITGGEIYHITNNVNGITYESDNELVSIMEDSIENNRKYIEMGEKAKKYYKEEASIDHMAKAIIDAVEYTLK